MRTREGTGFPAMRRNFLTHAPEGLALLLALVVALGLTVNAAVALSVGLHDLLWPVSLSAQFAGFFYFTAGLVSLAGLVAVFPLLARALDSSRQPDGARARYGNLLAFAGCDGVNAARPLAFVAGAAVAGLYIDLIIVFYSLHYRTRNVWIFTILALLCGCVACVTLPRIWKNVGRGLKVAGISLTALAAVAQFWYRDVYVPENTQVGIDYGLALGSVARSGSERLVQVDLTMKDESAVTALTLDSMVVVSGISYPSRKSMILRVLQPIQYNNFLFPQDTYSEDFLVVVRQPAIEVLHFGITLDYVRTTGLTLGNPIPAQAHLRSCPGEKELEWPIKESELRSFTEGPQALYSDSCADPNAAGGPSVNVRMATPAAKIAMSSLVSVSSRDYTLTLGDSNP